MKQLSHDNVIQNSTFFFFVKIVLLHNVDTSQLVNKKTHNGDGLLKSSHKKIRDKFKNKTETHKMLRSV